MKLVGTENGQSILIFPIEELRPIDGLHAPDAVRLLVERYQFLYSPDPSRREEMQIGPIKFGVGKLQKQDGQINILDLEIYRDGLLCRCFTTDDAEAVLEDLREWGVTALGLRMLSRPPRKLFTSSIVVEFESNIDDAIIGYNYIADLLSQHVRSLYEIEEPPEVMRISLNVDPAKTSRAFAVGEFLIERRTSVPYEYQRFFSQAPLPTKLHIEFLQRFEQLIMRS